MKLQPRIIANYISKPKSYNSATTLTPCIQTFLQKLLRLPGDTNFKNRCVLIKEDVSTLRLILIFRPILITVNSRQVKCSLHHAAFQIFFKLMAWTFKNTAILQNSSRDINYNRGTTEGGFVKTVDKRRTF